MFCLEINFGVATLCLLTGNCTSNTWMMEVEEHLQSADSREKSGYFMRVLLLPIDSGLVKSVFQLRMGDACCLLMGRYDAIVTCVMT